MLSYCQLRLNYRKWGFLWRNKPYWPLISIGNWVTEKCINVYRDVKIKVLGKIFKLLSYFVLSEEPDGLRSL
jgi:hypothetical protein